MPAVMIRRAAGLALLIFSIVLLAWGLWPLPTQMQRTAIQNIAPQAESPAELERMVTIVWPAVVRIGDVFTLHMDVLPPEATGPPGERTLPLQGMVEARLELTGIETAPPGETSQVLPADRPVRFIWQARADRPEDYSGTIWLHLRSAPGMKRQILSAPRIELQARSFLGLNGTWARGLGGAGIVLGTVFGLDSAAVSLWQTIRRKRGW